MRRTIILLVTLFFSLNISATELGYKITVRLSGATDTALLLAHYMGSKQYLDDTAYRNKHGYFVFEGTAPLKEGMYLVAGDNKNKYFDFFLTGNPKMEFSFTPAHVVNTMQVKGSDDNKAFFEYIRFLGSKQSEIEPFRKWIKNNPGRTDSLAFVTGRMDAIDKEVKAYIRNFYTRNTGFLSATFVKANTDPDYLHYITGPDGKVDSSLIYQTYKQHYFDNFTFSDPRLIYTPVFAQKMDFYFDKLAVPVTDSLEADIDRVMELAGVNRGMQSYLGWFLSLKYETSTIMGQDALFVYIVRKYLEPGKVDWYYPEVKDNILKRIKIIEPLLLGKVSPNLILLDTIYEAHSLLDTKAKYTLLFFWESTCGHCKMEMPKVLKFYDEFHKKYNLEIFGVSTDTSMVEWKAYIRKNDMKWINVNGHLSISGNYINLYDIHSTPIMYLLDENKKILTKFIMTDEISKVILRREESLKKDVKEKAP